MRGKLCLIIKIEEGVVCEKGEIIATIENPQLITELEKKKIEILLTKYKIQFLENEIQKMFFLKDIEDKIKKAQSLEVKHILEDYLLGERYEKN